MSEVNLIAVEPGSWEGTHITFSSIDVPPERKTQIWNVDARDGTPLGQVRWFARWRRYAFYPVENTVYEQLCMREIAQFIEDRTREHKSK